MNMFWLEDFNYLGTRIRLTSNELLKGDNLSMLTGTYQNYSILIFVDGIATAYLETTK